MSTRLSQGQFLSRAVRAGERLHCREGRLLATLEGVTRDFDLHAGHSLVLPADGLLVVEALVAAQFEFIGEPKRARLLAAFVSYARRCFASGGSLGIANSGRRTASADFAGRQPST